MKAVVFHDVADIRLETVADPAIIDPNDAIVRITTSAICGTEICIWFGAPCGAWRRSRSSRQSMPMRTSI
jgi:threonine dehydrogenase-like Zn-dependent dehydrogenase